MRLSIASVAFVVIGSSYGSAAPPHPALPIAPRVDSAVEVVRKIRQGYLVTPTALIPFVAEVRADRGLERVSYIVAAARLERGNKVGSEGKEETVPVGGFTQRLRQRGVREFRIAADDASSALDLSKLAHLFKDIDPDKPPCHYRVRVWLEATDNSTETGPHTGRSEPITFVVVSELELLAEVANEEELLQWKLDDRVAERARRVQFNLQKLNDRLTAAKADQFPEFWWRATDAAESLKRAPEDIQDLETDYRRIVRELRANRVRADMIDRVEKTVCGQLDESLRREFTRSADAIDELCKRLEGDDVAKARKAVAAAEGRLDALLGRIRKVVDATRELNRVNRDIRLQLKLQQDIERILWP